MWKAFPKNKPRKEGWYLVTIEIEKQQRYVRELYWYPEKQMFWDNIKQNICNIYHVLDSRYKVARINCNKTGEVVAFRKLPKTYMKGFLPNSLESNPYEEGTTTKEVKRPIIRRVY